MELVGCEDNETGSPSSFSLWVVHKAQAREKQHSQERNQMVQNMHDESMRRRSESAQRSQEMTNAINRGIQNAREAENSKTADAFVDRNRRLLDRGMDAVKRERSKTYFS